MRVSRGSIYLRGQTWTINYTVGGRRVREAIGTNKKLAEMVLSKRVTEAIENRWFASCAGSGTCSTARSNGICWTRVRWSD